MKQLKRSIPVCLVCLLLILACKINVAAAGASISFSDPTAKKGEAVTVTLKVTSGSNALGAVDLSIVYDDNALEFTGGGSAVKGGSGSIRIADTASDAKTKTMSYELTFTAKKAGKSSITVSNYEVVAFDESVMSVSHVGSATVEVTDESVSLSKDASLKDLKLSNGSLTPAFSPSIMNYTATVGADVASVVVSGTTTNEKAAITSISGADNLKEGSNTIKVSVTAESGATAVYTITVTKEGGAVVEATPTVAPTESITPTAAPTGEPSVTPEITEEPAALDFTVQVNDKTLTPTNLPEGAELKGYKVGELEYQGHTLQALVSDYMELYVINMQDETGAQDYYVYYKEIDQFTEFIKIDNGDGKFIVVLDGYPRDISIYGFERTTILINEKKVGVAWKYTDELIAYSNAASEYYLVGGLSDSGVNTWYVFDYVEKTYQRYFVQPANLIEEETGPDLTLTEQEQQVKELQTAYQDMKNKRVMTALVLGGVILILLLVVINLFLKARMLKADLKEYEDLEEDKTEKREREPRQKRERVVEPRQPRVVEPRVVEPRRVEPVSNEMAEPETKQPVKKTSIKKTEAPRTIEQVEEEEFFDEADMIPKEMEAELLKDKMNEIEEDAEFEEALRVRSSRPKVKPAPAERAQKKERPVKGEPVMTPDRTPKSRVPAETEKVKKSQKPATESVTKPERPTAAERGARSERPVRGERPTVTERPARGAKSEKPSRPTKPSRQPLKPGVKKKPTKVIEKEFKEDDFNFEFIDLDEE